MIKIRHTASFGKFSIPKNTDQSAHYTSKSWSEISAEYSVAVCDIRVLEPDMPSTNLHLGNFSFMKKEICSHCGILEENHEFTPEFIKEMEKIQEEPTIKINDYRKHYGLN
jgi:hypothetical protein